MKIISLLLSLILIYKYLLSTLNITGIQLYTKSNVSFSGAYDDISNIVHHYEIARRGFTSYEGNLVLLRRDSDNAELAFSSDANGDLDTAAITTWLAGANGLVVTVYDQVSGEDATQATAGNQLEYTASGTNGKPAIVNTGNTQRLQTAAFSTTITQPYMQYAVGSHLRAFTGIATSILSDGLTSTTRGTIGVTNLTPYVYILFAGTPLLNTGVSIDTNNHLFSAEINGSSSNLRIDGTDHTGTTGTNNLTGISLGNASAAVGTFPWDGEIYVVTITNAAHSAGDIAAVETIKNDYYTVY